VFTIAGGGASEWRTERDTIVASRFVSRTQLRRGAVVLTVLAATAGYAAYAGASGAGAAPAPSIATVQKEVNTLQGQVDKLGEESDAASQQLTAAQTKLSQVSKESTNALAQYQEASSALASVAVAQYENTNATSIAGLLSSGNPNAVLGKAAIVMQVEGTNNMQAQQLLAMASNVNAVKDERQRTEQAVIQLAQQDKEKLAASNAALKKAQALLSSLNAQEQAQVVSISGTGDGGGVVAGAVTSPVPYSGANVAVRYVLSHLGDAYVWGATGPTTFDCSGLMYAAYLAANLTIPRTTEEEWAGLPQVSLTALQPGDLILYNGESHVAMYVGNNEIVDAPHSGAVVEEIPMNSDWYAQNEDGAVRP
jgi:cell wall-associated NlpC family hydrolase